MTLIAAIFGQRTGFLISDVYIDKPSNKKTKIFSPFRTEEWMTPNYEVDWSRPSYDYSPKSFSVGREYFLWAGAKWLANVLEKRIRDRDRSTSVTNILKEFFEDSYVEQNFSIIRVSFKGSKDVEYSGYGCSGVEIDELEGSKGLIGGSGAGDLLYGEFENETFHSNATFDCVIKLLVNYVMRERYDLEFFEKAYGHGLRIMQVLPSGVVPVPYKVDFLGFVSDGADTKIAPHGGFRYFSVGRREFFSIISPISRKQSIAVTHQEVSHRYSSALAHRNISKAQYEADYRISVLISAMKGVDKIHVSLVDKNFLRYPLHKKRLQPNNFPKTGKDFSSKLEMISDFLLSARS